MVQRVCGWNQEPRAEETSTNPAGVTRTCGASRPLPTGRMQPSGPAPHPHPPEMWRERTSSPLIFPHFSGMEAPNRNQVYGWRKRASSSARTSVFMAKIRSPLPSPSGK